MKTTFTFGDVVKELVLFFTPAAPTRPADPRPSQLDINLNAKLKTKLREMHRRAQKGEGEALRRTHQVTHLRERLKLAQEREAEALALVNGNAAIQRCTFLAEQLDRAERSLNDMAATSSRNAEGQAAERARREQAEVVIAEIRKHLTRVATPGLSTSSDVGALVDIVHTLQERCEQYEQEREELVARALSYQIERSEAQVEARAARELEVKAIEKRAKIRATDSQIIERVDWVRAYDMADLRKAFDFGVEWALRAATALGSNDGR